MDFEEATLRAFIEDRREVFVFEAATGKAAYAKRRKAG
jgi:hypothetical protein